jgi:hypothetical protein
VPRLPLKFGTEKHGTAALAALREASARLLPLSKPPFFVYQSCRLRRSASHLQARSCLRLPAHRTEQNSTDSKGATRNLDEQPGRLALRANRSSTAFRRRGSSSHSAAEGAEHAPNNAFAGLRVRGHEAAVPGWPGWPACRTREFWVLISPGHTPLRPDRPPTYRRLPVHNSLLHHSVLNLLIQHAPRLHRGTETPSPPLGVLTALKLLATLCRMPPSMGSTARFWIFDPASTRRLV